MIPGSRESAGGSVDAFLAGADPCDPALPPHVRLGALYARARQGSLAEVAPKLLLGQTSTKESELELQFHAALLLARSGEFEGVRFLLKLRREAAGAQVSTVEMALRNCSHYPLAALAALSIPLPVAEETIQVPEEAIRTADHIRELVKSLAKGGTLPSRSLGTGVVVQRPLNRSAGFRHTGFILIEGAAQPRLMPFDMGDLLNSDAADTVRAGSSVAAVYSSKPPFEVLALYVLPAQGDLSALIAKAALGVDGAQIGIVADIEPERNRYRIVTASGLNMMHSYATDHQELGRTCILHPDNMRNADTMRPLMMHRSRVPLSVRQQVLARFRQAAKLDIGVRSRVFAAKTGDQRHEILSRQGHNSARRGSGAPDAAVYRELNSEGHSFWYSFPDDTLSEVEAADVIKGWIAANPDTWGIALPAPLKGEDRRCILVRSRDGYTQVRESEAGTLLSFRQVDGRTFVDELEFVSKGNCTRCLGSGHARCNACQAEGLVTCPECKGGLRVTCSDCGGSGKATCRHCSGSGRRDVECRNCSGTGKCGGCDNGWKDLGECNRCQGTGFVRGQTCTRCDGSGRYMQPHRHCNGSGVCPRCDHGTLTVDCQTCRTTGFLTCGYCVGTGKAACRCGNGRAACPTCSRRLVVRCSCKGPAPQIMRRG